MGIYDYSVERPDGTTQPLSAYEGKVLLIVNTATGCGFTLQYRELEEFYRKYHDKGLEILDIPCNQFAGQTPGTDEEIHEFCTLKYHTEFPQMKKSDSAVCIFKIPEGICRIRERSESSSDGNNAPQNR